MFKALAKSTVRTVDSVVETIITTSEAVEGAALATRNAIWSEIDDEETKTVDDIIKRRRGS